MPGAYARFRGANVMGVRKYIEPGDHILLIKRTDQAMSTNPKKKGLERTVVEMKIVATDSPDTMKVGNSCSLVECEPAPGYLGNILAFVAGVLGETIDEVNAYDEAQFDDIFDSIFGTAQVFTGQLVRVIAQKVPTTAGGEYTAKTWEPVDAVDYEKYGLVAPQGAWTAANEDEEGEGAGDHEAGAEGAEAAA